MHLLRADDFQGVCDAHLVEARLKAAKALTKEINAPAPPRERRSAAARSNRFVRGASPGTGRARLEIARISSARPAWPVARESPSSITGARFAKMTRRLAPRLLAPPAPPQPGPQAIHSRGLYRANLPPA